VVGLSRFELLTPRLSSVCSNQLSYRPVSVRPSSSLGALLDPFLPLAGRRSAATNQLIKDPGPTQVPSKLDRTHDQPIGCIRSILSVIGGGLRSSVSGLRFEHWALAVGRGPLAVDQPIVSRKEVIQPQVLLQLPCYDFTPITDHTLGTCLPCGLAGLLLVQPAFVM
jgi:hypothetical protein